MDSEAIPIPITIDHKKDMVIGWLDFENGKMVVEMNPHSFLTPQTIDVIFGCISYEIVKNFQEEPLKYSKIIINGFSLVHSKLKTNG